MQDGARVQRGEWNDIEFRVQLTNSADMYMSLTTKSSRGIGRTEARFRFDGRWDKIYYVNQLAAALYYGRGGHNGSPAEKVPTDSQYFMLKDMEIESR